MSRRRAKMNKRRKMLGHTCKKATDSPTVASTLEVDRRIGGLNLSWRCKRCRIEVTRPLTKVSLDRYKLPICDPCWSMELDNAA